MSILAQISVSKAKPFAKRPAAQIPTNPKLWARCQAWARRTYKVHPSAYSNAAAAKRYKSMGGRWRKPKTARACFPLCKTAKMRGGLGHWFEKEKWVDISRKVDGKHPPCGRSDSSRGGKPRCRPEAEARKLSPAQKKHETAKKRRAERGPRKGKKPISVGFGYIDRKSALVRDLVAVAWHSEAAGAHAITLKIDQLIALCAR